MKYSIAGKETMAYNKVDRVNVGDNEGHMVSLLVGEGINVSTGNDAFGDGAQVSVIVTSDMVNFKGPFQAYSIMTKKGDSVFSKAEGKIAPTVTAEGNTVLIMEGTMTFYKGTGQYENIQGNGTFKGRFFSSILYTLDWEGEYWIGK
jgi:hypothetical protein